MKNNIEIMASIGLFFMIFLSIFIFTKEVFVRQELVLIKSQINEILEINRGYTSEAKEQIIVLLDNLNVEYTFEVTNDGLLDLGEDIVYNLVVNRNFKLLEFDYTVSGRYYNIYI